MGFSAFQSSAFQNNAFQIGATTTIILLGGCHTTAPEKGSDAITLMAKYNQRGRHDDAGEWTPRIVPQFRRNHWQPAAAAEHAPH